MWTKSPAGVAEMARSIVAVVLRSLVVLRILVARVVGSTETCVGLARIKGEIGRAHV